MSMASPTVVEPLRSRSAYLSVQSGEKRRGPFFVVALRSRGDDKPPRIGLTVTRAQGSSVERNRIKRRLREIVRTDATRDMKAGNDYVIIGRREILSVSFDRLKSELSRRIRD